MTRHCESVSAQINLSQLESHHSAFEATTADDLVPVLVIKMQFNKCQTGIFEVFKNNNSKLNTQDGSGVADCGSTNTERDADIHYSLKEE